MTTIERTRRQALLGLLVVAPVPAIGAWMGLIAAPGPLGQTVFALSKVWILAVPFLWTRFVEHRSPRPNLKAPSWRLGVLTGIGAAAVILGFYALVARNVFDLSTIGPIVADAGIDSVGKYVAVALYWTFVNSLIEEYVWRWFVTSRCEVLLPRAPAIVLSAALFAVHHYVVLRAFVEPAAAWAGTFGVFGAAIIWSWLYLRDHSVITPYLSHVIADAAIFVVGWHVIFGG